MIKEKNIQISNFLRSSRPDTRLHIFSNLTAYQKVEIYKHWKAVNRDLLKQS
jgi:hypothetical protein